MESIEVYYGGYFQGGKWWSISFNGSRIVVDSIFKHLPEFDGVDLELPSFDDMTRVEFLRKLWDIHMGEWKKEYINPDVLDGTQWSVEIRYNDGKECHFSGSNMYPYNFNEFLELMRKDHE